MCTSNVARDCEALSINSETFFEKDSDCESFIRNLLLCHRWLTYLYHYLLIILLLHCTAKYRAGTIIYPLIVKDPLQLNHTHLYQLHQLTYPVADYSP
jgi:hypothetical protein